MVGNGARRMARWSTAIVLVGAVSSGTTGTAFGYAEQGVNVPDSTFRQGTGTQEITVSIAAPAVGTGESLLVRPFYTSTGRWLIGVTADRATGATCAYDVGQWQCTPGLSGWHAGDLHVLVSTAEAMDCGREPGVCQADELSVQSIPAPPDSDGPPSGQPFNVLGNVVIMPASVHPTSSPRALPVLATAAATSPATEMSSGPSTRKYTPAPSLTATPAPDGSPLDMYAALLIPVLVGVGAPLAFRMRGRRRQ